MLGRRAESSDDDESTCFKLSTLDMFASCLCGRTVRCTNSSGMDNLFIVFWKFNRRFDRPSSPSPAKENQYESNLIDLK
jgi:hypothetical protein